MAYEQAVTEMIDGISPWFLFFPFLQREVFGKEPWARFRTRRAYFDCLLDQQIDQAAKSPDGKDILSLLLSVRYEDGSAMTRSDIKDQLRTLLVAGHETTALALSWAFDRLLRNPPILRAVQDELSECPNVEQVAACPKSTNRFRWPSSSLLTARPSAALSGSPVTGGGPEPCGARRTATKIAQRNPVRTFRTGHWTQFAKRHCVYIPS